MSAIGTCGTAPRYPRIPAAPDAREEHDGQRIHRAPMPLKGFQQIVALVDIDDRNAQHCAVGGDEGR